VGRTASAAIRGGGGVDDFSFSSMTADYTLTRAADGTSRLRVVETIVAQFPDADQNHGIRRQIPDSYNGQPLRPELISVTDGDGTPRPSEVEDQTACSRSSRGRTSTCAARRPSSSRTRSRT
jgi:hypothetical protein